MNRSAAKNSQSCESSRLKTGVF